MDYIFCPICGTRLEEQEIEERKRRYCPKEECGFIFWDNPVPVVAAIIEYNGDILLVRNKGWPEKMFALVTGFLERNESPEEGVLREVAEETGLTGTVESLIGVYPFAVRNQVLIAYHVKGEGDISLGNELEEYKAVPPDKVRPWKFGTGLAVKDWLENRR